MIIGMLLIIVEAMPTSTLLIPIKKMMCGKAMPVNPPITENFIKWVVGLIVPFIAMLIQKSSNPPPSVTDTAYMIGLILPRVTNFEMAGTLPRIRPKIITRKSAVITWREKMAGSRR